MQIQTTVPESAAAQRRRVAIPKNDCDSARARLAPPLRSLLTEGIKRARGAVKPKCCWWLRAKWSMGCSQQPWCYGLKCAHNETFSMFAVLKRALTNHLLLALVFQRANSDEAARKLGTRLTQCPSLSDPTVWSIRTFQGNSVPCSTEQNTGWCQTKLRHTIVELSTLPCRLPMFLCVCSVGGRAHHEKKIKSQKKKKNDNTAGAKHLSTEENLVGPQGRKKYWEIIFFQVSIWRIKLKFHQ